MFKVLRSTDGERYGDVCTCEDLENARAVEFALDRTVKEAGGTGVYFAILDTQQQAIVHKTEPLGN